LRAEPHCFIVKTDDDLLDTDIADLLGVIAWPQGDARQMQILMAAMNEKVGVAEVV
jgi:hypothetical protein